MDSLPCLTCGGIAVSRADDPTWGDCPRCGVVEIDSGKLNGEPFEAYSVANHLAWEEARRERAAGRGATRADSNDPAEDIPF
jgi:hypothetical protein